MPRIIRGGLVQTSVTHEGTAPLETIKKAMIDKTMGLIEEAARKGCQVVCLQELFYGPYFCAEQKTHWYAMTEPIPAGPTTQLMCDTAKRLGLVTMASSWASTAKATSRTARLVSGKSFTFAPATSATRCSTPPSAKSGYIS